MTLQTQAVLAVLLERETWGFELSKESGLPAGTVYPILRRLTAAKWVTSRWESADAAQAALGLALSAAATALTVVVHNRR